MGLEENGTGIYSEDDDGEKLEDHTVSNEELPRWSSYEKTFQEISEDKKWRLSSSQRNVEDVLHAYALKLEKEQLAHSFIVDTSDDNIRGLFSEIEWREIMSVNKKTVPAIDRKLGEHLLKYKKKTPSAMRMHIMKPWLSGTYNIDEHFDFQYVHQVFSYLLDEYESPKNQLLQPHLEGWYAINIWSIMIDKAFLNVQDIELVRGDSASVASGNRKKNNRNKAEKGTSGRRPDGIFKSTVNNHEYGGIEVAKTCQGPHDKKQLGDSLKLGKLLKDMFDQLSSVVNHNEAVIKEIEVVGLLHSRLQLQQLLVDYGGGSCLRLIKEVTTNVPVYLNDVMELINMIISILRAKLRVQRCIAVLKDDSEDALFLREITQPPSCPSTPPNEQEGYLTPSRTVTCPTFKSPEKATKVKEVIKKYKNVSA